MAKLVHYFKDADMRCTHKGLTMMARKSRINPDRLGASEYLLFVNRAQTMFKLLGPNNVMVHVRSSTGRLDLRTLQYLPSNFSGENFSYKQALKKVIEKDFKKRQSRR